VARVLHRWACTFEGGRPILDDPAGFKREVAALEGKRGTVAVSVGTRQKSNEQNRYYRGVVCRRLAEYWGYTNDEAHRAISREHLTVEGRGDAPSYVRSTRLSDWTTAEWEEYMAHLRRWGLLEFGVYIEEPNEVDLAQLGDTYY
jgi:hypothetical protein